MVMERVASRMGDFARGMATPLEDINAVADACARFRQAFKALLQQPEEVVKELAASTDARHMTPLMLACENGCEGAVRLLLGSKKACAGAPRRCTPPTSSVPP